MGQELRVLGNAEYLDVLSDGPAELVLGRVSTAHVVGGGQLIQRQRANELLKNLRSVNCYYSTFQSETSAYKKNCASPHLARPILQSMLRRCVALVPRIAHWQAVATVSQRRHPDFAAERLLKVHFVGDAVLRGE